ncbi:MAG: flavodoxin family protein [Desulfovibrio sp.]|nr:flavodoxin family protein [Desulfovibrio sp.]
MKICALFGGPHKQGNTAHLLEHVLAGAQSRGHICQRFDLVDLDIRPCKGCMACKKPKAKGCVQKDDMGLIYEAIAQADLLIFASPLYWWNLAGPLKNAIDRFFALPFAAAKEQSLFAGKKLMLVMTSGQPASNDGREGLELILQKMCSFTGMTWVGTVTTGTNEIPVEQQPEICARAYATGANL